jgi:ABC-type transport system involved in multi-copper enzyme maturation permease subunit
MGSVNIFNDDKIVRYLKEICLLFIWISSLVIAINTTSRQIPMERENRTLFPLLAKPLTRTELLLGKYLGCWLVCGMALVCFYTFFGILAASREHHFLFLNYFQAALLHWFALAVVIALTLFGSLVFTAPSSNSTICFVIVTFILLLGRHLNKVAVQMAEPGQSLLYSLYYIIPHLELFDVRDLIIHNWPLIAWSTCGLALLYAAAYTAAFLIMACLVFRRRALN